METIEYGTSHGIVREWLFAKYSIIHNNHYTGMFMMMNEGRVELLCEYDHMGGSLIFDDDYFYAMKEAGYFTGDFFRHMGEGSVMATNKAVDEIQEDERLVRSKEEMLLALGYKPFMLDGV